MGGLDVHFKGVGLSRDRRNSLFDQDISQNWVPRTSSVHLGIPLERLRLHEKRIWRHRGCKRRGSLINIVPAQGRVVRQIVSVTVRRLYLAACIMTIDKVDSIQADFNNAAAPIRFEADASDIRGAPGF